MLHRQQRRLCCLLSLTPLLTDKKKQIVTARKKASLLWSCQAAGNNCKGGPSKTSVVLFVILVVDLHGSARKAGSEGLQETLRGSKSIAPEH